MKIDIIKAWKDEEYRSTLTAQQLETISNPVATLKMTDEQMENINGGTGGGAVTYQPWNPIENPGNDVSFSDCCAAF